MPTATKGKKYKLLKGVHIESHWEDCGPEAEGDRDVINVRGKWRRRVRKTYQAPCEFTTTQELQVERGRLELADVHEMRTQIIDPNKGLMEKMTVDQLQSYAKSEGFDLAGAKTKDEIIEAITVYLSSPAPV